MKQPPRRPLALASQSYNGMSRRAQLRNIPCKDAALRIHFCSRLFQMACSRAAQLKFGSAAQAAIRPAWSLWAKQATTFAGTSWGQARWASSSTDALKVVVVGSGYAGFSCAKNLNHEAFDVTVVRCETRSSCFRISQMCVCSPRNHMLFTPLLAGSAVGTLEFRSIAGEGFVHAGICKWPIGYLCF